MPLHANECEPIGGRMNTTAALNHPCSCVNGGGIPKRWYKTEAEADDAAKVMNDQYPKQPPQLPYRCEEGGVWHLTCKPKGTVVNTPGALSVNTRLHAAAKVAEAAGIEKRERRSYPESLKLEAIRLKKETDMTAEKIAEKLEIIAPATIYLWMRDKDLVARYEHSKAPTSFEQLDSEEQKLERQLAELRAKKQAAIEAKKWKFMPCFDGTGILMKKGGEKMGVLLEDARDLIVALDGYLKASGFASASF